MLHNEPRSGGTVHCIMLQCSPVHWSSQPGGSRDSKPSARFFGVDEPPEPPVAGLFADVVFTTSRPRFHLRGERRPRGVHRRGQARPRPFGRGDRTTIGYCVRLSETPPTRPVKELTAVLDDERSLTIT